MNTEGPNRLCSCQENAEMQAVAYKWDHYNSVTTYHCKDCGDQIEIIPLSHIGYTFTVGALTISFIIYIFIARTPDAGFITYAVVAVLMIYQLFTTVSHSLAHWLHPLKQMPQETPQKKGFRARIEGMSFLSGVALPIVLGGLLLGAALLLGVVHDIYFPPP